MKFNIKSKWLVFSLTLLSLGDTAYAVQKAFEDALHPLIEIAVPFILFMIVIRTMFRALKPD